MHESRLSDHCVEKQSMVVCLFVCTTQQAADNQAAAANEARLIAEALATQAKVNIELEAKKAKEAAEQQIADDLKRQQLFDEESRQLEEELCRKRKCEAVEGANLQAGLPRNTKHTRQRTLSGGLCRMQIVRFS